MACFIQRESHVESLFAKHGIAQWGCHSSHIQTSILIYIINNDHYHTSDLVELLPSPYFPMLVFSNCIYYNTV